MKISIMRLTSLVICFLLLFGTIGVNALPSGAAEEISGSAEFLIDGVKTGAEAFNDNNLSTKYKVNGNIEVTVSSQTPIKGVYMLFNKPPQAWEIAYGDESVQLGWYGIMHEYVELEAEQTKLSMSFLDGTEICDIRLYTQGELPSDVERWSPPCDDADILLLPTHADDDFLYFGGIIPYYAGELKMNVQVAYLTNHYGEWYRPHELLAALWHSGVTAYPVIPKFNDYYSESLEHAKTLYNTDEMIAYQVELLRRFKPEVVVAHDINGEYGHGVHRLNTNLLMQSLEISGDRTKLQESSLIYGEHDVQKTYIHLYKENELTLNYDEPLSSFGGKTAFQLAEESFALHASQTQYFKVQQSGPYDCRKFGLYRSTVGEDTGKNDLFENVVFKQEPEPVVSSEVAASSKEEVSSSSASSEEAKEPQKASKSDFMKQLTPGLFIIAGILVLIFTMRAQGRKQRAKTLKMQRDMEKRLSREDEDDEA